MKISFAKPEMPKTGAVVALVLEGGTLLDTAKDVDQATNGMVTKAIQGSTFEGKKGQTLLIGAPPSMDASRVLLVGLGKAEEIDEGRLCDLGGTIYSKLAHCGDKQAVTMLDEVPGAPVAAADMAALIGYGATLASYRFDKYRTTEKKEDKPQLAKIVVGTAAEKDAKKVFKPLDAVAQGVFLTRDLVSEPANILHPEEFADRVEKAFGKDSGVTVEVLDEKEMKKLGMGALLGVAQGSVRQPRMVVMKYDGGAKKDDPIAFVGKGVCFDSGGISLKPAGGMEDMKWDMGGAGVVTGLMKALSGRKAKVNAVGVLALVENMPDANAQRPGDVVKSAQGQTIEVINTDAEGRLILADALWYAQEKLKVKRIIDLATLTGAIIIALGKNRAGIFTNDDDLAEGLSKAGEATGEPVWRFPLGEEYDKQLKSDIADMKNVGGREAGSITAAQFLQRFIDEGTKWCHIDIAGVTWSSAAKPTVPKGGTAFGVRLLDRLVSDAFETK